MIDQMSELYCPHLGEVVSFGVFVDVPRFHGGEEHCGGAPAKNLADEQQAIIGRSLETGGNAVDQRKYQTKRLTTVPLRKRACAIRRNIHTVLSHPFKTDKTAYNRFHIIIFPVFPHSFFRSIIPPFVVLRPFFHLFIHSFIHPFLPRSHLSFLTPSLPSLLLSLFAIRLTWPCQSVEPFPTP